MVDRIVVMVDGTITETGTYEELVSHDGAFAQFLRHYMLEEEEGEEEDQEGAKPFYITIRGCPGVVVMVFAYRHGGHVFDPHSGAHSTGSPQETDSIAFL
ncbi:hypothetical protein DPMN_030686 [Dreissena polymorpha]|uniref:Uncharacterized protein n=1 Tax=Dreissena polymorpha TaxID=45954 RepID=A0A9D4RGL5_DREPO|nr:hypothetical protein DPMN_030686 [Dreissena polymorpha]